MAKGTKKRCTFCRRLKPLVDFSRSRTGKDGCKSECKVCAVRREQRRRRGLNTRPKLPCAGGRKRCNCCGKVRSVSSFSKKSSNVDGLECICRTCYAVREQKRRKKLSQRKRINVPKEKVCPRCGVLRSSSDYYRDRTNLDGLHYRCKTCHNAKIRAQRYGVSQADYEGLLQKQKGVCAVCRRPFKSKKEPAVDHDHKTGAVRGLLCTSCNCAIGYMKDDPKCLRRAAMYLEA